MHAVMSHRPGWTHHKYSVGSAEVFWPSSVYITFCRHELFHTRLQEPRKYHGFPRRVCGSPWQLTLQVFGIFLTCFYKWVNTRSSNVQTWCHHAQMSAWQGSAVPRRLLHTSHRCCRQAASQLSHTATNGGSMTSAIHCWTPSFHCVWNSLPDDLRARQDYESFRQGLKTWLFSRY